MAAVASGNMAEPSISPSQSMGRSSSARLSDVVNSYDLSTADIPGRPSLDRSSSSSRQSDDQNILYLKSEEYRQLFRLPPDEFLIQDFNCALQENFLLQGHMYLFGHYICFYSNLFGFETKKIIPFNEITSVRRAKAAAIFPTAIEILAGGKKYFFTSFLSRDEAFKIINDGWLQQSDGVKSIVEQQDSVAALNVQGNENSVAEQGESSRQSESDLDTIERHVDCSLPKDIKDPVDGQLEMLSTSTEPQVNVEEDTKIVQDMECSPSRNFFVWEPENSNGPSVPECYTIVAESKFPVKVKEFFGFCFSDDSVDFEDLFHRKCGDKGFRCSKWRPDEKIGQIRNASFQHPIKMYLGAKFGSCSLVQKYRIYRHSHLVVESIQEITDVPYGDYFRVEVLWDVKEVGESKMGCVVRVYVHVNFCKKTMFRGKIVQSSVDECRDVYGTWIGLVHELLKQKSGEIQEGCAHAPSNPIANNQICAERQDSVVGHIEPSKTPTDLSEPQTSQNSVDTNQHLASPLRGSFSSATEGVASFRDSMIKFCSILKGQSQTSLFLVISIAVILLLMQVSILVLLSRPQQIHVISQADCMSPVNRGGVNGRGFEIAFIEKRMKNLKEEMHMTESLLEKMQLELEELELLRGEQRQFRTRRNL